MPHPPLGFLLVLDAVLLVAVYLAARLAAGRGPTRRRWRHRRPLHHGGLADDGRDQEATVYVIDLQNGAAVPIRFKENKERFEFSRGRSLRADVAAVAGRPDAR